VVAINTAVSFKPFPVPDVVYEESGPGSKANGMVELPSHPIETLDYKTLDALCNQFRKDVMAQAHIVEV
jgi:hypothetical protein